MKKFEGVYRVRKFIIISIIIWMFAVVGEQTNAEAAEAEGLQTEVQEVYLNQTSITLAPATTKTLKLKGTEEEVEWSSSNKKIAKVNADGKVTAKAKGTTQITAVCDGTEYVCEVTVAYGTYESSDGMVYRDSSSDFGRTGRWFKKSISGGKYYFTNTEGSSIYFKVNGSKYINVNFVSRIAVATPYFAYSVDGGEMKRQLISNKKISVGNTKTHYVRLVIDAMSESENRWGAEAGVGIKSITPVTKSGVVTGIQPQNEVIAFYGDSITQGVRALSMDLMPAGTSATHSYAWYCAQKLKMVPYFAGYGGSGIAQTGCFSNCANAIAKFSSKRKATKFDAKILVVEHGTNDVYSWGEGYTNAYKKVVQLLHKTHPKAQIMLMIPFNQTHAGDVRQVAKACKKYCTAVETSSWKISYTDGLHPNVSGAKTVGKNLAKKINAKRKVNEK